MILATVIKGFYGSDYEPKSIDSESHVPALRELAHTLIKRNTTVVYDTEEGEILLRGLMKRDEMAVSICSMPKGTEFPEHNHKVVEWLMVSSGELEVRFEGRDSVVLRAGESLRIQPKDSHSAIALTTVEVLAVTMPAEEGFPDER